MRAIRHSQLYYDNTPTTRERLKYKDGPRASTLILDLPDSEFFRDAIYNGSIFDLDIACTIGLSIVNPLDQFCRKIGMSNALKQLKETTFKVNRLHIENNKDIDLSISFAGSDDRMWVKVGKTKAFIDSNCHYVLDLYTALYGRKP